MATLNLSALPSLRRQHLLAEFSGLKQACPEGVFVSLTPGDPTLWTGVMFIRRGPYENLILRFQISFPDTYPGLPPLVTFSTDIFHPLIAPLTTYMYTTDIQDSGTVSATDDERLPPGGFSLRHGFPGWFGRGGRQAAAGTAAAAQTVPATPARGGHVGDIAMTPDSKMPPRLLGGSSISPSASSARDGSAGGVSTYEVLRYIRSTFDDENVLDSVTLEAAGNPGAWHAWRTRQLQMGKGTEEAPKTQEGVDNEKGVSGGADAESKVSESDGDGNESKLGGTEQGEGPEGTEAKGESDKDASASSAAPAASAPAGPATPTTPGTAAARKPGEWNWEGVWELRVKKGIAASLSEPVLYGGATAGDDLIHFLPMEENDVGTVKDNLLRTLGSKA